MNLSPQQRSMALGLTALAAPMLIVQGMRMLLMAGGPTNASASSLVSSDPMQAPAGPYSNDPKGAIAPAHPLSKEQTLALAWINEHIALSHAYSPMASWPEPVVPPPTPSTPTTEQTPGPAPVPHNDVPPEPKRLSQPLPKLICTSIIASGSTGGPNTSGGFGRSLATINKRVYRLGDEVAPGWTIMQIDAHRRLVILAGPDAQTFELSQPSPETQRTDAPGLWME